MSDKTATQSAPKLTKVGLNALSKSPSDRTPAEHRQARKAELALVDRKRREKEKENAEKQRLKDEIKEVSKGLKFTGVKRMAYRVKMFWVVPNSRPKRFYPVSHATDVSRYPLIKSCTILLLEKCMEDPIFGDKAIALWTLLENPPTKTRRVNLAASCRKFADEILDYYRD